MSAPDLTLELMNQFKDSGAEKHVTLLLGAGASTASGLPGWDELAARLLLKSDRAITPETAELLLEHQDPLLVAESARQALGPRWDRSVRAALYEGQQGADYPTALHLAVAAHVLSGKREDTTVLTLNFDTLLESALALDVADEVESRIDGDRVSGAYGVHHLHGLVTRTEAVSVTLTLKDFNELLGQADAWQLEILRSAVREGVLIIAGTSFRDPDVRRWLHVALSDQPVGHRALVLLARQGFDLSRVAFRGVEAALARQWRSIGLEPVILEDFSDAAQIIRELRYLSYPDYRSPQQRARLIWDAHLNGFATLQAEYVELLDQDARMFQDAFGVDQLNLTLWLADANGHVARWAAQDRTYRSAKDLRLVDSGHDSRWVAGRALGSEDILFQDVEEGGDPRWGTVLAAPIRVEHSGLPEFAAAVLSVGLPGRAQDYAADQALWQPQVLQAANLWSERLVDTTFAV